MYKSIGTAILHRAWPYRAASLLLALLAQVVAARLLGGEEYGRFAMLQSAAQIIVIAVRSGYNMLLLRAAAEGYTPSQRTSGVMTILRVVLKRYLFVVLATLVAYALSNALYSIPAAWLIVLGMIMGLTVLQLAEAIGRAARLERPSASAQALGYLAFIALIALGATDYFIAAVGFSVALSVVGVILGAWGFIRMRNTPGVGGSFPFTPSEADPGGPQSHVTSSEARWVGITGALRVVMGQTDTLLVGLLFGPAMAGTYSLGWRFASLVSTPLTIENFVRGGVLGRAVATHAQARAQDILRRSSLVAALGALAAVPVALAAGGFGPYFLDYGPELLIVTAVLAASQAANALGGPVILLMSLAGEAKTLSAILLTVTVINLATSVVLALIFGYWGVAAGTLASQAYLAIVGVIQSRRRLDLDIGFRALSSP